MEDWYELAMKTPRAEFVARYAMPFLVGGSGLQRPTGPTRTVSFSKADLAAGLAKSPGAPPAARPVVLAVRKVQEVFPSMITVGRTPNNDVTIPDERVSKFHAAFRIDGDRVEVSDHNSRNGTSVAGVKLVPGVARALRWNDVIRFGNLEFDFCNAGGCWDRVRRPR